MRAYIIAGIMALLCVPAAQADMPKIETFEQFLVYVEGKRLKRPLIELVVTPDGKIRGRGARWEVEGTWNWQNGYFCRELYWGGDPLGYNCQEVRASGDRIRFTSDKGAGDTAVFRLN